MSNKVIKDLIIHLAISGLLFFNLTVWQIPAISIMLFIFYLLRTAPGGYFILIKFFNFTAKGFRVKILGAFASLMMLGVLAGISLVFYKLSPFAISLVFLLNGLLFTFLKNRANRAPNTNVSEWEDPNILVIDEMPSPIFGVVGFLALVSYGFYLLIHSRTGEAVLSPWQVIDQNYIFVYLLACFVLGVLIFSNLKAKTILFLIFVLSLLMHSYLPLTHQLLYGADGWRHVASESRISQGMPLADVALSEEPLGFWHQIDLGKISYSQFWGVGVILSKIFSVSLLNINIWLMPLLWAIIFPILLFEFGRLIGLNKKEALFLSWLGLLPFAWQTAGSFTLPVNLGFLWWFLLVLLILKSVENGRREQKYILIGAGIALFFGYALYFLLFVLAAAVSVFVRKSIVENSASRIKSRYIFVVVAIVCSIFYIPAIELIADYSFFDKNLNLLAQIKQLIGNFTGWYLAAGPRPHDIAAGNIILNQTPSYALVFNVLTATRWWLVVAMIMLLLITKVGLIVALVQKNAIRGWLVIMSASVCGGYIISRYFLSGEQVLSRRLDNVFALCIMALSAIGMQFIFKKYLEEKQYRQFILVVAVFIFAVTGSAIYSLGPDTQTVSADEFSAMQSVWNKEKSEENFCVLADTFPLLALEAISSKQIVGGGFPINEYFAQPERVEIYNKMLQDQSVVLWAKSLYLTKAQKCFLVAATDKLKTNEFAEKNFKNFTVFGKIISWEYIK